MIDWAVLCLGVCLAGCIAGIVVIVITSGNSALAGTGLGGLTAILAAALTYRVRSIKENGKGDRS